MLNKSEKDRFQVKHEPIERSRRKASASEKKFAFVSIISDLIFHCTKQKITFKKPKVF